MKRIFLTVFLLSALLSLNVALFAQGAAEISIQSDRMEFRGAGDEFRNLVTLESRGQLQTIRLMSADFTLTSDIYIDSIQNEPKFDLTVNVPSLTTGFDQLDTKLLSKDYLNFGDNRTIEFKLLNFATGRVYRLENEKRIEAAGQGVISFGEMVDTVRVEMGIRYLAGNEITKERLSGNLVHFDGSIYFRLSGLGIEIPKENRLMVNDQVQLKFDIFASTEFELPAMSTSMMGGGTTQGDMASGGGQ